MTAARIALLSALAAISTFPATGGALAADADDIKTATPIKHVIIIIGENRSFDHLFGLYKPRRGQTVSNLLSKGILNADGTPGPQFAAAAQAEATPEKSYFVGTDAKKPYEVLPPPDLAGTANKGADPTPADTEYIEPVPFATEAAAAKYEHDLAPADIRLLTTGATGLATTQGPDTRVANATHLANGPFPLSGGPLPYDSYTGDTVHRFFQMWQQSDCARSHATPANPSGCLNDLYAYVAATEASTSKGGGTAMGFYNVNAGDAPYLKKLAERYTMADNYHQAEMGGTMVEHIQIAAADTLFYADSHGQPTPPPATLIADPDPRPDTANQYKRDGAYTACADLSAPGITPIDNFLRSLPHAIKRNCAPDHYYAINNMSAGYRPDGTIDRAPDAVPPSNLRTIGDALAEKGIPFAYYGGGWNDAVAHRPNTYCDICNPFAYTSSMMADPAVRRLHNKDVADLRDDIANGTVPSVAYVKPDGWLDGHPQSSKVDLFEAFTRNIVDRIDNNKALFASTAIFVTFDEAGGYWDSGYIQPLDFFGDGPRIPFIVVSPYAKGGRIVHTYDDHASVVKFIERNWGLGKLTRRSRDNLPNPIVEKKEPYVPVNSPAIGDLFDMFQFPRVKH